MSGLIGFLKNESGAVTVDWVVLAAATVGLGIATVSVVAQGSGTLGTSVRDTVGEMNVSLVPDEGGLGDWASGAWEMNNPGIYEEYRDWMANFGDEQLLTHMNNMAEWKDAPPGSGHPVDTYHDEYWIARDEAIKRGLIEPS